MSDGYVINELDDPDIQALCRVLNRYIEISRLDRPHLIHSRILYLLLTAIESKTHPNWAVMVHAELIKTLERTSKNRIACPHVITRILKQALRDQSLEPEKDYDDEATNEAMETPLALDVQELFAKFQDIPTEAPTISEDGIVNLGEPLPTPPSKASVKPKARKIKIKIARSKPSKGKKPIEVGEASTSQEAKPTWNPKVIDKVLRT